MPEVILDGPGAGMTTREYEEMRDLDCNVGTILGWRHGKSASYWHNPTCGGDPYLRDEPLGVPFFSLDMNGAHSCLAEVLVAWSYIAQSKFWEFLQKRASYDPVVWSLPEYPDVFRSLITDLPTHICHAFVDAWRYHNGKGLDPKHSSLRATNFVEQQMERHEYVEVAANGDEMKRFNPKPTSTPWVKDNAI